MFTQFYTKHFQQKTGAVAKPGGSYKARRLVLFLLFSESRCSTLVGSLITVTLSENKHIVGQRPRTQIQSLLLSTSLFSKTKQSEHRHFFLKTDAPITPAAFELISGHFEGQFKTSS